MVRYALRTLFGLKRSGFSTCTVLYVDDCRVCLPTSPGPCLLCDRAGCIDLDYIICETLIRNEPVTMFTFMEITTSYNIYMRNALQKLRYAVHTDVVRVYFTSGSYDFN